MSQIPCKDCLVFPICRSKYLNSTFIEAIKVIGLAHNCSLLNDYIEVKQNFMKEPLLKQKEIGHVISYYNKRR